MKSLFCKEPKEHDISSSPGSNWLRRTLKIATSHPFRTTLLGYEGRSQPGETWQPDQQIIYCAKSIIKVNHHHWSPQVICRKYLQNCLKSCGCKQNHCCCTKHSKLHEKHSHRLWLVPCDDCESCNQLSSLWCLS